MKRVKKTQGRQALESLKETFESQITEEKHKAAIAADALAQYQLDGWAKTEQELTTLRETLKKIQAKVEAPPSSFGFLENMDASVFWLIFAWLEAGDYTQLIKAGQPFFFVCFHIGTFYLVIRSLIRTCFLARNRYTWQEIVQSNRPTQLIAGVSSLADVWAHGRFGYPMSISLIAILSIFGSINLYSGVINAINTVSRVMKTATSAEDTVWKMLGFLLSCKVQKIRQDVKRFFDPNQLRGNVVWPVQNVESPMYGKPDLLLPLIDTIRQEVKKETRLKEWPLYAFEFWKVKRNLKAMIKKGKAAKGEVETTATEDTDAD